MVLFEGDQIREGGPNPQRIWSMAGPTPLADLARPDQIRGGPNPLVHRQWLRASNIFRHISNSTCEWRCSSSAGYQSGFVDSQKLHYT